MSLKALYMFMGSTANPAKHKAVLETETAKMFFIGVSSIEEGAKIAQDFVNEGGNLIELCGAFGYEGAKKIHDQVGDKVPVGMMVHQVRNAALLAKLLQG